jgi:hypothetical protein
LKRRKEDDKVWILFYWLVNKMSALALFNTAFIGGGNYGADRADKAAGYRQSDEQSGLPKHTHN